MKTHTKGQLGLKILYGISVGVMIPTVLVAPNAPIMFAPLLRELAKKLDTRPQSLRRSLMALKRNRLLAMQEKSSGETVFVLSEDGKRRVAKGQLDMLAISQPKKWDNKWRIVLFDVPERQKTARDALHRTLRDLGFCQIQKSCFVHPYECRNEVDFITEIFMISEHVMYMVVESLEGEHILKKHFKL